MNSYSVHFRRAIASMPVVVMCCAGVSGQCLPGDLTSLYPVGLLSSFRQTGFAVKLGSLESGELLAVSTDNFDGSGSLFFSGAGFVYRGTPDGMSGFTWVLEATLKSSDSAGFDQAGSSMGLYAPPSGDALCVIGSPLDDNPSTDAGSITTYARNAMSGAWVEEAKLSAPDRTTSDLMGLSSAIDGSIVLAGAPGDDHAAGTDAGSGYVFRRDPDGLGGHEWVYEAKITAIDAAAGDRFGSSVAIKGDVALIGARLEDEAATDGGSVYVYMREADGLGGYVWNYHSKIVAPDAAAGDQFGAALSMDGRYAVVGAPYAGEADVGAAYLYEWVETSPGFFGFTFVMKLTEAPGDEGAGDQFGSSVDVADDVVIVGAYLDDNPVVNSGSVSIFSRRTSAGGVSVWERRSKFTPPNPVVSDDFGYSVATHGGFVLIGATAQDQYGTNRGNTYFVAAPVVPVILEAPAAVTLDQGQTLVMSVEAGGAGPIDYQWLLAGVELVDDARISGAMSAELTVMDLTGDDAGEYTVEITNSCGTNLAMAMLVVNEFDPCLGDANFDDVINFADITVVLANFGMVYGEPPTTGPGDASADGLVNFSDITAVLANFGMKCP